MWLSDQPTVAKENANVLLDVMRDNGITNPLAQAAILAVCAKESSLIPKTERSYKNTDVSRIRAIFGKRVGSLSDNQISSLKQDDVAFFDQVYGSKWASLGLGNDRIGDGYKYRGRGFNQITGKDAYKKYGELIKKDLVSSPDLLNQVPIASAALIAFFKRRFSSTSNKLAQYNNSKGGFNDFKTLEDALGAFYHANSGWGKSKSDIVNDVTGAYPKTIQRAREFLIITANKQQKKNNNFPLKLGVFGLIMFTTHKIFK